MRSHDNRTNGRSSEFSGAPMGAATVLSASGAQENACSIRARARAAFHATLAESDGIISIYGEIASKRHFLYIYI